MELYVMAFLIGVLSSIPSIWLQLNNKLRSRSNYAFQVLFFVIGSSVSALLFAVIKNGHASGMVSGLVGVVFSCGFMICYHGYIYYRGKSPKKESGLI